MKVACIEGCQCTNHVGTVLYTCSFVGRMHSKLCKTDIYGVHGYLLTGQISKCAASGCITAICKMLYRNTRFFTNTCKYSRAYSIGCIFLIGTEFYYDSFIQISAVGIVCFFRMVRMNSVSIISGNHEAFRNGTIVIFLCKAQIVIDSL